LARLSPDAGRRTERFGWLAEPKLGALGCVRREVEPVSATLRRGSPESFRGWRRGSESSINRSISGSKMPNSIGLSTTILALFLTIRSLYFVSHFVSRANQSHSVWNGLQPAAPHASVSVHHRRPMVPRSGVPLLAPNAYGGQNMLRQVARSFWGGVLNSAQTQNSATPPVSRRGPGVC
jgi:hypothetical protein